MRSIVFPLCWSLFVLSAAAQQSSSSSPSLPTVESTTTVLGSPEPVTQGESPRVVVVMDTQQHRLAFQDIEDYLRTDSSVDIQQRSPGGVQSDISIRGSSFEQTLVLVNGLRINDAETSHFNLDLPVPLPAISAIDVLHGAGSALYGSDALGGVVDFVTAAPEATSLRLTAGAGSFGENQQSFLASWLGHHASEVLAGSRDFSTGFIADRDYRTASGSSETRLDSRLGKTDILLAGDDRPYGAAQFYGNYNSWERTKAWFASLSQQLGDETQAAVAYRRHSDIFVLFRDDPSYYKNQHIDESWEGAIRRRQSLFHDTTLYYGLEADTDQIRSTSLGEHGRNRGAGYADVDVRVAQRGTISAGLREEVLSGGGGRSVLNPSLAGSLWVHPRVKLRGSIGYGFRLPTYVDLYYSDPSTIGNPNLKPESAWSYDGGIDWYPSDHAAASLTVFYSRQHNAIDYVKAAPSDPWQASNLVGLRFTGVEGSLFWRLTANQQVKLAWTWISGAQDALHGLISEYVFNYPVNNATFEWTSHLKPGLLVRSRTGITERYQQDPCPVWDLSVAREAGRIHPFLQMMNLSNTGYQEIAGVPMPGRSFTGGIELDLSRRSK
ncbi:TonB-dependent receptor plug domain-containing protein [Paracidobacterium acidisoli]|uniref:TonB-dependent receptor n=1 Tax=Paracidobacterium acidisoli TaxID=2303751 RepID=A0A372ITY0_9BACT|nr:TonB-dependent receptor [Paracidobacterium acidisoli]MBT9329828.1 TonB-dependent receptor [Paracidobacterium acidisoli]